MPGLPWVRHFPNGLSTETSKLCPFYHLDHHSPLTTMIISMIIWSMGSTTPSSLDPFCSTPFHLHQFLLKEIYLPFSSSLGVRHFLNGISRETFKLCVENDQQHGLMSRLYQSSHPHRSDDEVKLELKCLIANTTAVEIHSVECFIAGWDFNSCFMIRALYSQLVPGISHHHHHRHNSLDRPEDSTCVNITHMLVWD